MTRYWRLVGGERVEYNTPQAVLRDADPGGSAGESGVQNR